MKKPLVSVLVPVYNAGVYLREAIGSIVSQSYDELEIIVVDDGSTDGCVEAIQDMCDSRVRIVRQANAGRPGALNHGLDLARGEFFLIQDADDISYRERVEKQVAALVENPDVAVVYAGNDLILQDGRRFAPIAEYKDRRECREAILRFDLPAHDATGLYRASMVGDLRFDNVRLAEGVDFVWRVGERFPSLCVGACLYSHRVNHDSITHRDPARSVLAINTIIEKACERRGWDPDPHRLPLPRRRRLFPHRMLDTIVPYAIRSVVSLKRNGRWSEGFRTAGRCLGLHLFDPYYYKPLAFAVTPLCLLGAYRRVKARCRPVPRGMGCQGWARP